MRQSIQEKTILGSRRPLQTERLILKSNTPNGVKGIAENVKAAVTRRPLNVFAQCLSSGHIP